MIEKLNSHYSMTNPASVYDEEALTSLELVARTAAKVNEVVEAQNTLRSDTDNKMKEQDNRLKTQEQTQIPNTVTSEVLKQINNGTFDRQINEYAGDIESRLDNLLGSVTTGSTTLDAEVIDLRVGTHGESYENAGASIRTQINGMEYNKVGVKSGKNRFDKERVVSGYLDLINGKDGIKPDINYITSDYIPVKTGEHIFISNGVRKFLAYTKDKKPIVESFNADGGATYSYMVTVDGYIRFSTSSNTVDSVQVELNVGRTEYEPYKKYIENGVLLNNENLDQTVNVNRDYTIQATIGKNKFDKDNVTSGYIGYGGGDIVDSDLYVTSDFIHVVKNQNVAITGTIRKLLGYNINKEPIIETYQNDASSNTIYTPPEDGYIRISVMPMFIDGLMIEYNDTQTAFEPYKKITEPATVLHDNVINRQIIPLISNTQNVLSGKKYVACGDSFTQGVLSTSFESGKYAGYRKVYPYFIGNRNDMNVVNLAKGGMTMCNIDGTRENAFSNNHYKQIPLDADYITLKFGINDDNYNSPLGTIDDVVNTTFYGAWNVVMEYIVTNIPFAKVGIIVTNGTNRNELTEATRKIARKWGVPILDEAGDYNVPLLNRVHEKTEICDTAINARTNAFRVSESDGHPNDKAHEYESTFVEAFMRNL